MAYEYHFDEQYPLVYVNVKNKDTFYDHVERIKLITDDSKWAPGHSVLIDFTETTEFKISNKELEKIAIFQAANDSAIGEGKLAVVAPRDIIFGLTRMWEIFVESKTSMEIRVFKNRREAVKWLGFG